MNKIKASKILKSKINFNFLKLFCMKKKRLVTGLTPTGHLTIGNYFGVLKPLKKYLTEDYELFIFIANLHGLSIPTNINPKILRQNIIELMLVINGIGISNNVNNCFFYLQSDHNLNPYLGFLSQFFVNIGDLERMTQYKDKKNKFKNTNKTSFIPVGLLTYPTLMAADIYLYDANIVPVGDDQKQHIELTKKLAQKINNYIGTEVLTIPTFHTPKKGSRIMSLTNPEKKMSKSDININSSIYLLDDDETIKNKIMKSKTDSFSKIKDNYEKEQLGISNLLTIYSLTQSENFNLKKYIQKVNSNSVPYKKLKIDVANSLIQELKSLRASISDQIKLNNLTISSFQAFLDKNKNWYPDFYKDKNWLFKKNLIEKEGSKLMNKLLKSLGLQIK